MQCRDEMECGVAGGVYDLAFGVYGVKQDRGKAMKFYKKAVRREIIDHTTISALCMITKRS
ncbi:hypothetical protein [Campylobacter rectus]|uniref:hypothetical protein n=1 Tax=Campylobacter rectus TaxID=203 RepID=UPI0023F2F627|nr:hypothetical protein [Campylobacter rectus]